MATEIADANGRVDGVLNVADIIRPFVPISDLDRCVVEKVLAVNFWGVVISCRPSCRCC